MSLTQILPTLCLSKRMLVVTVVADKVASLLVDSFAIALVAGRCIFVIKSSIRKVSQ
ncbi:hypothetical protein [Shewanella waksmanii]|uniref:hypothetical protein n=1 Tax=Shewanella waksmanii TaxID=213783 RepID=UPI00373556C8